MLRRRWIVLAVWGVALLVAGAVLQPRVNSVIQGDGSQAPGSESQRASALLVQAFHVSTNNVLVVFLHSDTKTADDPTFQSEVLAAAKRVQLLPYVRSVITFYDSGNPSLVSRDRHSTLLDIVINGDEERSAKVVPDIRAALKGLRIQHEMTGAPAVVYDVLNASEEDLHRSELFTIPIVLILLLLVFRTVVAATIPLMLGLCSVVLTLGLIYVIGSNVATSVFALNIASMIGLGLGIDFALIVVGRYREEMAAGLEPREAVVQAMSTAGRSITYSGITVMLAMVIMTFFMRDLVIIRSISMAVVLVALTSLLAALTLLPVVLDLLGHRIESLRVVPTRISPTGSEARWYSLSLAIMRHPWMWLLASFAILVAAMLPIRDITFDISSPDALPRSIESVQGTQNIAAAFGPGAITPIQVVIKTTRQHLWTPDTLGGIQQLTTRAAADSRTASVASLATLARTAGVPSDRFTSLQPSFFSSSPTLSASAGQLVNLNNGADVTVVTVASKYPEFNKNEESLVKDLRTKIIPSIAGLRGSTVLVGGAQADFIDYRTAIYSAFPYVVVTVMALIFVILLMFFQSVVLPTKAMLLNLVGIFATLGLLVIVFQRGFGSGLLGFTAFGRVDATMPAVLYVILISLSTDYEVFMLSRVREYYHETGSNREAVARGLASTAGVITAAALVLIGTFGSFVTAGVVVMKEVGFGLAVGVLIDATLVRVVMVPSTMRLMGRWNWWMPSWLKKIVPEIREGPSIERTPQPASPQIRGSLRPTGGSIGMPFVNLPADRPFRIGRDARNELQLFDPQVSRFHAQILPAGDGFAVQDLGSTNGMYVNYNRIPPGNTVTLKPGDSIQVGGKWELNFAYDVAAPEPATST